MSAPEQLIGEAPHVGRRIGRYLILDEIASGGMATVHLAHVVDGPTDPGPPKFVAAKCMHAHYARDPDFVSMFTDEATLCTHIRHENVVGTIDVTQGSEELLLVLELVEGESLSKLVKSLHARKARVPQPIVAAVVADMLRGLHAAHEATNAEGEPLLIVHRDVSPHNVLVGTDGVARVLDFGVAKARGRVQQTQKGQLKGKLAYMSPEQARGRTVDRRSDVFSAGIVLWELLTGHRLLDGENEAALLVALLSEKPAPPSSKDPVLARFDALVQKALEVEPDDRYATALEMADAVERAIAPATRAEVASWVKAEAKASLDRRHAMIEKAGLRVKALLAGASPTPSMAPPEPDPTVNDHPSTAPASGLIEKNEPVAVIDLGWSIPPKPAVEEATAVAPDPRAEAPTVPAQVPRAPASAQGAVQGPGGPLRPRVEPRLVEPKRPGGLPIARPALKPLAPTGLRSAKDAPRPLSVPHAEKDPLWDTSTTTDDGPPTSVEPTKKLRSTDAATPNPFPPPNPLPPSPTQVLPATNEGAEAESVRDATLPLYQPSAAFLEAAGIHVPGAPASSSNPAIAPPPSSAGLSHAPLVAPSAAPSHGQRLPSPPAIPPQPGVPGKPMSGSGDWTGHARAAQQEAFGPGSRGAPVSAAVPSSNPGAEGISSQVSSVNLTTLDIPPPLPDATVKRLQVVAVVSGVIATVACIALLVILTRKPWTAPVTPSATPSAVAPDTVSPPPAPAPVPMPEPNPAPTSQPISAATPPETPTASASAPAPSAAPTASPVAAAPTSTSTPTFTPGPKPTGFLGRPASSSKPKPKK